MIPSVTISGNINLVLNPGAFGNTLRVTTRQTGDFQRLNLPLIVQDNLAIKAVTVCYDLRDSGSFISQMQLAEETTPPITSVRHDDDTDLTSTDSECVESVVDNYLPDGAVTLSLRLNFGDTEDYIDIGAIGLLVGVQAD